MEGGREGGGTCVCVCVCVWSGVEGRSEGLKEGRRSEGVTVGFSARRSYFIIRDLVIGTQVQREERGCILLLIRCFDFLI